MSNTRDVISLFSDGFPFMLIAIVGAWIRGLRFGFNGVWSFMASCATAAFTAFLASLALPELGVGQGMTGAVCGVIGYSGGSILDTLLSRVHRAIDNNETSEP